MPRESDAKAGHPVTPARREELMPCPKSSLVVTFAGDDNIVNQRIETQHWCLFCPPPSRAKQGSVREGVPSRNRSLFIAKSLRLRLEWPRGDLRCICRGKRPSWLARQTIRSLLRRRRTGYGSPSQAVSWPTPRGRCHWRRHPMRRSSIFRRRMSTSQRLSEPTARRTAHTRATHRITRSARTVEARRTPYGAMNNQLRPWPPSRGTWLSTLIGWIAWSNCRIDAVGRRFYSEKRSRR